jgi:hypothetical protein
VKEYANKELKLELTDEEIDDFFRVGKIGSTDDDANRLTAVDYALNIHAYPIIETHKSEAIKKISGISDTLSKDVKDWVLKINEILEHVTRNKVSKENNVLGLRDGRRRADLPAIRHRLHLPTAPENIQQG